MPANGITRLYNGTHLSFLAPKAFSNSPLLSDGVQLSQKLSARLLLLPSFFVFLLFSFFCFFFYPQITQIPLHRFAKSVLAMTLSLLNGYPASMVVCNRDSASGERAKKRCQMNKGGVFFRSLKELYLTNCFGWQVLLGSVCQFPVCGCLPSQWDNLYCYWSAACHHLQPLCQCP